MHFTIGTSRRGDGWTGVVRRGRVILARCGHTHRNREVDTRTSGRSAYSCIRSRVLATADPVAADQLRVTLAEARLAADRRRLGRPVDAAGRAAAAGDAARDLARILAQLRDVLGDEPVFGPADVVVLAPRPTPTRPCPRCGVPLRPSHWSPRTASGEPAWLDWLPERASDWSEPPRCEDGSYRHPTPAL